MQPAIKTKCIRVAVRIRPLAAAALAAAASTGKTIQPAVVLDGTKALRLRESVSDSFGHSTTTESVFQFDACYDGFSKQADIYQSEVRPWLSDCWQGINTTVFCYGATGSGKTHTAAGTASDAGLIPRAVNELLSMCSAESKMSVKLSYMEIYNEKCIDLLPTSVVAGGGQNAEGSCIDLPVREDANRRVQVIGLVEHELKNMDEFKRLFELGTTQRTCAATKLNAQSSRSHAVLMLKVERIENGKRYCGKLNLIDLAGSEDNRQTGNQGARMAESGSINCSLFTFGKVIHALNANANSASQVHVPYRDSKLTRILQDSLGGDSHAVMICCVAPEPKFTATTATTLHFAQLSRKIMNRVQTHVVEELQAQPERVMEKSAPLMNSVDSAANAAQTRKAELEKWKQERSKMGAPKRLSSDSTSSTASTSSQGPDLSKKVEQLEASVKALTSALNHAEAKKPKLAVSTAPSSSNGVTLVPLTPSTKGTYVKQHVEKARAHHRAGDFASELIEYQKASNMAPENAMLREKVDSLRNTLNGGAANKLHVRPMSAMSAHANQENIRSDNSVLGKRKESPKSSSAVVKRAFGNTFKSHSGASKMVDESSDQDANSDTDFSESDCSESESEAEPTPAKRKRPAARKPPAKRVSDQAPAPAESPAEVAESGVLSYDGGGRTGALARDLVDLLNSVTLKQLKALHTIGAKRAELIAQRRAVQPFATLSDLTSVGMSEKQIESFFEKNTLNKAPVEAPSVEVELIG